MEGVPEQSLEAFLLKHPRDKNSGGVVLNLSTRWQSWDGSDFCLPLIKTAARFALRQERVKNRDLGSPAIVRIVLSVGELQLFKRPSLLTGFLQHYFVRLGEACCNVGVAESPLGLHIRCWNIDLLHGKLEQGRVSCSPEISREVLPKPWFIAESQ